MAAFAESMTQQGLVDMDECNMDSCGRHGDDNSDHGDVRGREKTKQVVVVEASVQQDGLEHVETKEKRSPFRGRALPRKTSEEYVSMQQCVVFATIEESQKTFDGGALFDRGHKERCLNQVHKVLHEGTHRDIFQHFVGHGGFSKDQVKGLLNSTMFSFAQSGKVTAASGGRKQSGRVEVSLSKFEQACELLCGWQETSKLEKKQLQDVKKNTEAAQVRDTSFKGRGKPPAKAMSSHEHQRAAQKVGLVSKTDSLSSNFRNITAERKKILKRKLTDHMNATTASLAKEKSKMDDDEREVLNHLNGASLSKRLRHSVGMLDDIDDDEQDFLFEYARVLTKDKSVGKDKDEPYQVQSVDSEDADDEDYVGADDTDARMDNRVSTQHGQKGGRYESTNVSFGTPEGG